MTDIESITNRLLTVTQAAKSLDVPTYVIKIMIRNGELPCAVLGNRLVISALDLPDKQAFRDISLSRTLQSIFDFIVDYKTENDGNSPTRRQIVDAVDGVSSTSVVEYHLRKLEALQRIARHGEGNSRNIIVNGGKWAYTPPGVQS